MYQYPQGQPIGTGQTTQYTYHSEPDMRRGIAHMAAQGWQVAATMQKERRSGCMRVLMLGGIGALIWKPKPHYIVTYRR